MPMRGAEALTADVPALALPDERAEDTEDAEEAEEAEEAEWCLEPLPR